MGKFRRHRRINGIKKKSSHIVWHSVTGHWPVGDEIIHHINNDSTDDRIENLQLMSRAEHQSLHMANCSEETKAKMRINMSKRIGEKHPNWKGDTASPKAKQNRIYRARQRASKKGRD